MNRCLTIIHGNYRVASKKSKNASEIDWSNSKNEQFDGFLWNYINYEDAQRFSENMALSYKYDLSKIGTNLITGAEWDTAMEWIQSSGINVKDSSSWGNYYNSSAPANVEGFGKLQVSGYSEYWKAKNVYDLAGNIWEWTNEKNDDGRISRGSSYMYPGNEYPASYRTYNNQFNVYARVGFRVALYIK